MIPGTDLPWKLLVKHDSTSGQYFPKNTLNYRTSNGKLVMNLEQDYNQFRGADGKMTLKLVYPEFSNRRLFPKGNGKTQLVWKQSSSPLESSVKGYSIMRNTQHDWDGGDDFKGMCKSSYHGTLLDGQPEHGYWFYAVGAHQGWGGRNHFPGPRGSQNTAYGGQAAVQKMELWVQMLKTDAPTTSPTKAPTASPTVTPNFVLKAGSKGVEINEHGCITDGPGAYSANELAQITVNYDGMLDVIHFKTHDEYRVWNNGWTTMTYAQLYGGGNTKAPWWMHRNSAYYLGSYPTYYRNIAVGSGYEQYSSGDSGAISRQGSYRSYSKNGWYNDNWYFTDYLEVNGQRYHGPDSPDGVRVKAGTKMTWTTDGAHQEAGFIICLDKNPPPVPKPVFQIRNFNGQEGVKLTAQGCFTDGYGFYRSGEYSHIKVLQSGVLFARHFSTEKRYDTLTINGHQYSGDDQINGNSPDGVAVTAGSTIVWKSDHQMIRSGFIICLGSQEEHDCQAKNCAQWTCDEWCKCFDQKSEDNGEYQHFGCVDDNEETCDCPLNA